MKIQFTGPARQCKPLHTRGGLEQKCRSDADYHMVYGEVRERLPGLYADHDPGLVNRSGDLLYFGEVNSMSKMMNVTVPWWPFMMAMSHHFSPVDIDEVVEHSERYVGQVPFAPLLLTAQEKDTVIPPSLVRMLASDFRAAATSTDQVPPEKAFLDDALGRVVVSYTSLRTATWEAAKVGGLLRIIR